MKRYLRAFVIRYYADTREISPINNQPVCTLQLTIEQLTLQSIWNYGNRHGLFSSWLVYAMKTSDKTSDACLHNLLRLLIFFSLSFIAHQHNEMISNSDTHSKSQNHLTANRIQWGVLHRAMWRTMHVLQVYNFFCNLIYNRFGKSLCKPLLQ